MGIMDFFTQRNKNTANVAKERLRIIIAQERTTRGAPDYLPLLQRELLEVIRKYVNVDVDAVTRATPLDLVKEGLRAGRPFGEIRGGSLFGDFGGHQVTGRRLIGAHLFSLSGSRSISSRWHTRCTGSASSRGPEWAGHTSLMASPGETRMTAVRKLEPS